MIGSVRGWGEVYRCTHQQRPPKYTHVEPGFVVVVVAVVVVVIFSLKCGFGALVVTAGLLAAASHVFGQNKATSPSHEKHLSFFPQLFFRCAHVPLQTLSAITLSSCFAPVGAPPHVCGQNKATSPSHGPHSIFFPQLFFRCSHVPLQTLSAITLSSAVKPVRFAR